jgi:hypothetical protein
MVEEVRSWIKDNSTLIYFLIAQFIAIGAMAASGIAYMVKLETRTSIMETRGAEYTVARMEEMKLRIAALEGQVKENRDRMDRVVDVMTKRLNINP